MSDRSTPPGQPPTTLPCGLGDSVTGLSLVAGVPAALLHRERTGRGQLVAMTIIGAGEAITHKSITYAPSLTDTAIRTSADRAFASAGIDRSAIGLATGPPARR